MIALRLSNDVNNVEEPAVCDAGLRVSFLDKGIKTQPGTEGKKLTLILAGINGRKNMASERASVKVIANHHDEIVNFHIHPGKYFGNKR